MKRYKPLFTTHFTEELRLSDLRKDAGISALTKQFKKIRTKQIGAESRNAKLVDVKVNREDDYVEFAFITIVTPYPNDKDHKYGETDPPDWDIDPNASKKYEMVIRVLDFFKWIDTTPNEIVNKDIEDALNVANIQLSCNCPSFNWQGFAHKLTGFDASIYPQTIADPIWSLRHNDDGLICKHLQGLLNSIKFYIPQMRQTLVKQVR